MAKLKNPVTSWIGHRVGFGSLMEKSRQLGEKLGYGSVGVKSDATKNQESAAQAAMEDANRPLLMPDDEELTKLNRRRLQRRNRGRDSTILSLGGNSETLG